MRTLLFLTIAFSQLICAQNFLIVMRHGVRLDMLLQKEAFSLLKHKETTTHLLSPEQRRHLLSINNIDEATPYLLALLAKHGLGHAANSPLAPTAYQSFLEESITEIINSGRIPEVIITSPYQRATQTAQIVQSRLAAAGYPHIQILIDRRIQEMPYLSFERLGDNLTAINPPHGTPWAELESDFELNDLANEMSENGFAHDTSRLADVLRELAEQFPRAMVVTHSLALGDLISHYDAMTEGGYAVFEGRPGDALNFISTASRGIRLQRATQTPEAQSNCSCTQKSEQ